VIHHRKPGVIGVDVALGLEVRRGERAGRMEGGDGTATARRRAVPKSERDKEMGRGKEEKDDEGEDAGSVLLFDALLCSPPSHCFSCGSR